MAKLRISMQFVWVLVFLSIVLVFLLPQNAEATEWYLGINLKEGDFFRYNLCSIEFENCKPFELDFWVYGKTDYISYGDKIDVWKVKAIVIEENKTIIGDMLLGAVDYKPVSSSEDIQQYVKAFRPSLDHLSKYALSTFPKSLEWPRWCPIAIFGGTCLEIVGLEKISVASKIFDAHLLRHDSDFFDIKIWLDKDLAFPLKGYDFYIKDGNKIKYYEFELLEFGNSQTPPHFLESFNMEESTTPPQIKSPRHQLSLGVVPEDIICKEGLELIFKSTDGSPACVKPKTAEKLIERGWAS